MKSFLALALAGAVSATTMNQDDYKFMRYIVEHNKEYNTLEEFNMRRSNFLFMDGEISKLNTMANATSVHGHNYLSDYTRAEYQNLLGLKNMPKPDRTNRPKLEAANIVGLPTSVNWVTAGKVNAIKDQGKCGSDWAFSANAALESANAIFNGTLPSLSEQQLVSCSGSFGNQGCNGGWYYYAWDYAINNPIA
jgi:C1A family cysteine protease